MFPAPLILHLTSSLINLRLTIEPETKDSRFQTPIILLSPNRNITLSLQENSLFAENLPIIDLFENKFLLSIHCNQGFALQFNTANSNAKRVITSPSFCLNNDGMNSNFLAIF